MIDLRRFGEKILVDGVEYVIIQSLLDGRHYACLSDGTLKTVEA
jgi:hypothetical protein